MAHLDKGDAKHGAIAGIVIQASKFGLCGRGHDLSEDAAHSVDGTIVWGKRGGRFVGISRFSAEVEVLVGARHAVSAQDAWG